MPKTTVPLLPPQNPSSLIAQHGYDADRQIMAIQFHKGGTYEYHGVQPELYDRFRNAESIGKFFHAEIRTNGTLKVARVDEDEPAEEGQQDEVAS